MEKQEITGMLLFSTDLITFIRWHISVTVAMPNAESTSRDAPGVYKIFLSKKHKKMSNTCAFCYLWNNLKIFC